MGLLDFIKKIIVNKFGSSYQLGANKQLEKFVLDDMKEYPVWVNDLSGEFEDGFDESSQRPIIGEINVNKRFAREFLTVTILVKDSDSNIYATVNYEQDGTFSTLCIWQDNSWIGSDDLFPNLESKIFIAIPQIEGIKEARIKYNLKNDTGILAKGV
jgi:hypothetical protein